MPRDHDARAGTHIVLNEPIRAIIAVLISMISCPCARDRRARGARYHGGRDYDRGVADSRCRGPRGPSVPRAFPPFAVVVVMRMAPVGPFIRGRSQCPSSTCNGDRRASNILPPR